MKDELSDVELWQKSEDERLEYESYCNKIRKGLEDLDEKSGERAVWELVQNARDMSSDSAKNFINKFITTTAIDDICFEKIMLSNPFVHSDLDFQNLSERKVSIMIEDTTLQSSPERFLFIKENFEELHIKLLERQPNKLIEKFRDYTLDADDIYKVLQSSKFEIEQKIYIIQHVEKALIMGNVELSNVVGELLCNHAVITLESDLFIALIRNSPSIDNKITLLNLYCNNFNESVITQALILCGEPYSEITNKGKKPSIPKNGITTTLVQKLKDSNYISSFKEKEDKIKIYTFTS